MRALVGYGTSHANLLGRVLFNGVDIPSLMRERGLDVRKLATFVPREQYREGSLTVLETLTYAATVAPGSVYFKRHVKSAAQALQGPQQDSYGLSDAVPAGASHSDGRKSPNTAPISPSLYTSIGPSQDTPNVDQSSIAEAVHVSIPTQGVHSPTTGGDAEDAAHAAAVAAEAGPDVVALLKELGVHASPVGVALHVRPWCNTAFKIACHYRHVLPTVLQRLGLMPVANTLASKLSPPQVCGTEGLFCILAFNEHPHATPCPASDVGRCRGLFLWSPSVSLRGLFSRHPRDVPDAVGQSSSRVGRRCAWERMCISSSSHSRLCRHLQPRARQ